MNSGALGDDSDEGHAGDEGHGEKDEQDGCDLCEHVSILSVTRCDAHRAGVWTFMLRRAEVLGGRHHPVAGAAAGRLIPQARGSHQGRPRVGAGWWLSTGPARAPMARLSTASTAVLWMAARCDQTSAFAGISNASKSSDKALCAIQAACARFGCAGRSGWLPTIHREFSTCPGRHSRELWTTG